MAKRAGRLRRTDPLDEQDHLHGEDKGPFMTERQVKDAFQDEGIHISLSTIKHFHYQNLG